MNVSPIEIYKDEARANNPKLKKGDRAYIISISYGGRGTGDPERYNGHVLAHEVEIQSYGKKQGTAVDVNNGQYTKTQISVGWDIIRRTWEDVEALVAELTPLMIAEGEESISEDIASCEKWAIDYAVEGSPKGHKLNRESLAKLATAKVTGPVLETYTELVARVQRSVSS